MPTNPTPLKGLSQGLHAMMSARLIAGLLFFGVIAAGIWTFRTMPVDAFPDVTPTLVQVFTETDGLAPEEVERYVT